jgi:hypothetical protein
VDSFPALLKISFQNGMIKGWNGFLWMQKIILPVSFFTVLLDFSGWLERMNGILEPLMGLIYLPANAALPLVVGLLTGIYGAIAAMSALPMTTDQMTLIVVFLLIAHNLIQEGIVQHKSGFSFFWATAVRLVAAIVTVFLMGLYLGPDTLQNVSPGASDSVQSGLWPVLGNWVADIAWLSLKILFIITTLMVVMELLKRTRFIEKMIKVASPLFRILGLNRQVGMLWMTAAVFGITYGGAVIVEEVRENSLSPDQLKPLHISIGINHAMIEDPSIFLSFGLHPFWLWIPRLVAAIVATHLYLAWRKARRGFAVKKVAAPGGGR